MSGTVTPGVYTTLIPDTGASLVSTIQVPSPTMPVISGDLLAVSQWALNNDVSVYASAVLNASVTTIDGTGNSGITAATKILFVRVTGTGSASGTFKLNWSSDLPANSVTILYNAGSGNLIVARYGGATINTLAVGELGIYRHDQTASDALAVCTAVSPATYLPDYQTFNDELDHTINVTHTRTTVEQLYNGATRNAIWTLATSSPATPQAGYEAKIVNMLGSGSYVITVKDEGGATLCAVGNGGWVDCVYNGSAWRATGSGGFSSPAP